MKNLKYIIIVLFCISCKSRSEFGINEIKIREGEIPKIQNFIKSNYNRLDSKVYSNEINVLFNDFIDSNIRDYNLYYNSIVEGVVVKYYYYPLSHLNYNLIKGENYHYYSLSYIDEIKSNRDSLYRKENNRYILLDSTNLLFEVKGDKFELILNSENKYFQPDINQSIDIQNKLDMAVKLLLNIHNNNLNEFPHIEFKKLKGNYPIKEFDKYFNNSFSRVISFSIENFGQIVFAINWTEEVNYDVHKYFIPDLEIGPEIFVD